MLIPALSVSHVTRRYESVLALNDVSLDVARGECVALVGESGSGKTTLLRCFNRMVEPDSGRVMIEGADVRELDPIELRRNTGYVLQEGGLLPHWRVLRNVELVPWLRGGGADDVSARALDAMRLVGLDAGTFGARWPHELSGGQRQRVAMARALAPRPDVILLDEPFGALDAITRGDLQTMFLELRRARPVSCVLVTHDLHEAVLLADRIAVMKDGSIEQLAPPRDLIARPETPYVARLLERARVSA